MAAAAATERYAALLRPHVLAAVHRGAPLNEQHEIFRRDREVVLAAVKASGWQLGFAAHHLKGDVEVVALAVADRRHGGPEVFKLVPEEFRTTEFGSTLCQKAPGVLEYSSTFQADREVVMAAVSVQGRTLEFAVPELRDDLEVVLAAVRQDAAAYTFASSAMQANDQVRDAAGIPRRPAIAASM